MICKSLVRTVGKRIPLALKYGPYVVLRDAVGPSYGSPTQGCRVWFKTLCR